MTSTAPPASNPQGQARTAAWYGVAVVTGLLGVLAVMGAGPVSDSPWPIHGGVDNIRYSPLTRSPRERATAAGRVDLRLARRVQGLRDAEQPDRRRRRALRRRRRSCGSVALDAATGASSGRSIRRGGSGPRARVPPSRRHGARAIASSSPTATICGRSTGRRASRSRRSGPTAASICAKGSAGRPSD